jgi:hypothetical protein
MSSTNKQAEDEETPIAVTVSSLPVNNTPMVYAQPYVAQTPYTPYSEEQRRAASSSYYIIMPFRGGSDFDENMMMVSALSRSMKLLAMFDMVLLLIMSIWNLFFLFGLWGPVCGYYGAKFFKNYLVYIYAAYWVIRTVFDFALVMGGNWWFVLSLIIDVYLFSYIWTFARALGMLSEAELNRLQAPPEEILVVTNA